MFLVGRIMGRVDTRALLVIGLLLTAWAMYDMTGWTPNVSQWTIATTGFIQGAGLGFLFVPLTTIAFATLAPEQRGDAAGVYNLSRNVGSSVGISVVSYLLIRNNQINHATIASHVTAVNHAFNKQCRAARVEPRGPQAAAPRSIRSCKPRPRSSAMSTISN